MIIIKIILSMLFGFLTGLKIQSKPKEDKIKLLKSLISAQEKELAAHKEYIEYLEGEYTLSFQDAVNQLLKENINLRKKLKAYE